MIISFLPAIGGGGKRRDFNCFETRPISRPSRPAYSLIFVSVLPEQKFYFFQMQ
ncbi:MAG: hypothetical protein LBR79_02275 [Oscillospiraceae bacterium]|nr:hypothetical protein [Oscillospiraceae bacterium]